MCCRVLHSSDFDGDAVEGIVTRINPVACRRGRRPISANLSEKADKNQQKVHKYQQMGYSLSAKKKPPEVIIVNKLNNITTAAGMQELISELNRLILQKLPSDLEESAKAKGVFVRKRKIKSAIDLITILLVYSLNDISQRMLSAFACALGIANISDQAWQKKLQNVYHG